MREWTALQGGVLGVLVTALALGVGRDSSAPAQGQAPGGSVLIQAAGGSMPSGAGPVQSPGMMAPPAVALQDATPLDVRQPSARDSTELRLFVSNRDPTPTRVRSYLTLSDSATGRAFPLKLSPDTGTIIAGVGVQELRLWVHPSGASAPGVQKGFLKILADSNGAPTRTMLLRPVRMVPTARASNLMAWLVLGGLVIGSLVVRWGWTSKTGTTPQTPESPQSPPSWSGNSWATNLAGVGAALTVFSSLASPAAAFHYMTRAEYASLGLLLSGMLLLGTAMYAFVGVFGVNSRRWALAFLLALILGAALAQLATLGLLLFEAHRACVLPSLVFCATLIIVSGTGLGLLAYGRHVVSQLTAASETKAASFAGITSVPAEIEGQWHLP